MRPRRTEALVIRDTCRLCPCGTRAAFAAAGAEPHASHSAINTVLQQSPGASWLISAFPGVRRIDAGLSERDGSRAGALQAVCPRPQRVSGAVWSARRAGRDGKFSSKIPLRFETSPFRGKRGVDKTAKPFPQPCPSVRGIRTPLSVGCFSQSPDGATVD